MVIGITKRYEFTGTWDVLNDIIFANLTDPAIPKRQKDSEWIKNGFPNPGDLDKKEGWKFPLVIISIPDIDETNKTIDSSKQLTNHSISISCYSRTRLESNQIAEEIRNILIVTGKNDLVKSSLYYQGINGTTEDSDFIGPTKYFEKTIDYAFRRFD